MTEYQTINAERKVENLRKIIAASKLPSTFQDIVQATGINVCNVRTLITRNIEYFKYMGKTLARGDNRRRVMYQAVAEYNAEPAPVTAGGVIHRLQDSTKYHENMKLLRDNRKALTVFVSGSTLA